MSKAWICEEDDEYLHVYHTPNRNQARRFAANDIGIDYLETTVRRCPAMDDLPVTAKNMLITGTCGWYECQGCSTKIYADGWLLDIGIGSEKQEDDPTNRLVSDRRGRVWCSDECYQAWYDRWGDQE